MAIAAEEAVAEMAHRAAQSPVDKEKAMPSRITLKDVAPKYMESLRVSGKNPRTVETYTRQFEVVTGFFGEGKNVAAIRPADVGRFLKSDALLKKPNGKKRAEPTIKQIVRVLRMFFEWAQTQGMVETVLTDPSGEQSHRQRCALYAPHTEKPLFSSLQASKSMPNFSESAVAHNSAFARHNNEGGLIFFRRIPGRPVRCTFTPPTDRCMTAVHGVV